MTKIPLNSQSLSLTHTFTKPLLICKSLINKNSNILLMIPEIRDPELLRERNRDVRRNHIPSFPPLRACS